MITGNTASGTFYVFNKKEQSIPIVFVHGVGLTYEIWQPQLDFFKDYSNLSYDILGHGKSSLTKQNISFNDFSDQLIELINELKISKSIIIDLENDSIKNNPDIIFNIGHIRSYSNFLELDTETIVKKFKDEVSFKIKEEKKNITPIIENNFFNFEINSERYR